MKPGYKQTAVGVIPKDWDVITAAEACELVVDCKNRTPPVVAVSDYAVVRTPNVRGGKFVLEDLRFTDEASYREWTARAIPKIGDVLITREAPLGEVCAVPQNLTVCLGQRMMLYRPAPSRTDSRFLLFALMSQPVRSNLLRKIGGSTVGHAKVDDIRCLQFPHPPLSEQRAIADALSDVDGLLGALDRLIAKKRDLKQAAMQQLLTGQTRLRGFHGEWEVKRLSKHASLKARIGWQALTTGEYLDVGDYLLVTGTDFIGGRVNWSTCHFVSKWRYDQDRNIQIKNEDVLVTKDGTIGKVGYVEGVDAPATLNSGVFVIRPLNDSFYPLFLFYVLKSSVFDNFLAKITAGSTITHLYQKDFVGFEFAAPTMDEQIAIAQALSDMDAELATLKQRRDKTQALQQGIMQDLLTGKTRLV